MTEQWRPVVGFEGHYEVSDLGRVRRFAQCNNLGRIMKQNVGKVYPYRRICLSLNGHRYMKFVHVLVAEAFIGPRPPGMQVLHGPNGPSDNSVTNLSYGTPEENQADTERDGTKLRGSQKPQSKLNEEQVVEIRRKYAGGDRTWRSLAQEYGVTDVLIRFVVTGAAWKHVEGLPASDVRFNRKQKLSDDDVRELRQLHDVGVRNYELADRYGVDQSTISHITAGRMRKNVR